MNARSGMGYGGMGYGQMGYGQMGCGPMGYGPLSFGMGQGYGPQSFGMGQGYGPQSFGMGQGQPCPTCGIQGGYPTTGMPQFMPGMAPWMGMPQFMPGMAQPMGYPGYQGYAPGFGPYYGTATVPDDEQIREMIYDSLDADPLVPYDSDINVEVTGGLVTLTGTVPNKRIKHAVGDDAWWIPGVWDVNNQLQVAGRQRAGRPTEETPTSPTPRQQRPRRPAGQS